MPEKCNFRLSQPMGLSFDGQNVRMPGGSKNSFCLPKTECLDAEGLVPALATEGRTGGAWPVDHGQLGCGGSELGQGNTPSTSQNQILGALAWLSLLHRVAGTFLESPELCCILGWVCVCGGDAETRSGPGMATGWWEQAVPTQSVSRSLHCSWSSSPESCSSSPQRRRLSSLGAVVWCVSQEGSRGWEQEGSGATSGHESIWFG